MTMGAPSKEFEFPNFPRRDDEHGADTWRYIERYNLHRGQYRPWERAPEPEIRQPYKEPRVPGEDDDQ